MDDGFPQLNFMGSGTGDQSRKVGFGGVLNRFGIDQLRVVYNTGSRIAQGLQN